MLARLGRVFLVAALLLAQQSAFAHQIWHLGAAGKPQSAGELGTQGNPLCDQHQALDTVLGGLGCAAPAPLALDEPPVHFPPACLPAASPAAPSPVSRGPPALL